MTSTKPLAKISGTLLTPGVSRNNRLYTAENIGRGVNRMRERLADPAGLPIVMRTHHEAGDNSRLIVGRITGVNQESDGRATYDAVLFNTAAGRDIGALIDPEAPALKSTSIHGYWIGPVERVQHDDGMVESGSDLEIDAIDFTASPGVAGAQIKSVAFESVMAGNDGRPAITESAEATIEFDEEVAAEVTDRRNPIFEKYTTSQRRAMAVKGQAMPDGEYAIASKADLRGFLRTVNEATPLAVREHMVNRAAALGFPAMIPAGFTVADSVDETYVVVCVGDDTGPLVKVCAANVDKGLVMKAAKKAAKLAGKVLDAGPDSDTDVMPDMQVGPDDGMSAATAYDIGADDESHSRENTVAENWTISIGGNDLPADEVNRIVSDALAENTQTAAPVAEQITAEAVEPEEVAVSDATKAAETATVPPTAGLTETDVIRIVKAIRESDEAVAKTAAKAAKKAAKAAAKNTDSGTDATAESTTKADKKTLKENVITQAQLQEALAAERKLITDDLRESLVKDKAIPSRRGFRHVVESAEEPTREQLWDARAEVFASVTPELFIGTDLANAS